MPHRGGRPGCYSNFHEGNLAICGRFEGAQVAGLNTVLSQLRTNAGNQHVIVGVLMVRAILQKTEVNQVVDELGVVFAYSANSRRV